MNETVKDVLRHERLMLKVNVRSRESDVVARRNDLSRAEERVTSDRRRLADLDAALTEAGVDLAAEDAQAFQRATQGATQQIGVGRSNSTAGLLAQVGQSRAQ